MSAHSKAVIPSDRNGTDLAPRICMPTWRRFHRKAFQCGLYEAQDVLTQSDHVDLIELAPLPGFVTREKWLWRFVHRDWSHRLVFANPGLRRIRLARDYDVFI